MRTMTTNRTREGRRKNQPSVAKTKSANKTKVNGGAWQIKQLFNFKYSSFFFSFSLLFVACCRHFCCYLWRFAKRASTPKFCAHTHTHTLVSSRTHTWFMRKIFYQRQMYNNQNNNRIWDSKKRLRSPMFWGHAADKMLGGSLYVRN